MLLWAIPASAASVPRVLVSIPSGATLAVAEGGDTDLYTVVLSTRPDAAVTVDVDSIGGEVTASPNSLRFTSANWSTPQLVRVKAVDDHVDEASPHHDVLVHATTSSDPAWNSAPAEDVPVDIADDDTAALVLDHTQLGTLVVEGGTGDEVDVRLATRPTSDVEVLLSASEVSLGLRTVHFTPDDWNQPHLVPVSAPQDGISEGRHSGTVRAVATSRDAHYDRLAAATFTVTIDDADTPLITNWSLPMRDGRSFTMTTPGFTAGVVVTDPPSFDLDEADPGASAKTIFVRLASAPASNVTVYAVNDSQVGFQTVPMLVFTPSNWYIDQPLVVMPITDGIAEPLHHAGVVSFNINTTDVDYQGLSIPSRTFDIQDADGAAATLDCNPGPGWNVDPLGRLHLDEADPAGATCYLQVGSAPSQDLHFTFPHSPTGRIVADPPSITIPAGTSAAHAVTFRTPQDDLARGPASGSISFNLATTDPVYGTITLPPVDVDVADDDVASIMVTPSGAPIALAEGGPGVPVSIRLTSQPVSPVAVSVSAGTEVLASTSTIVFTPTDWNVPQVVTLTAIDDYLDEPDPMAAQLVLGVTTSDVEYASIGVLQLPIAIGDNDVAGVFAAATGSSTAVVEGGAGDEVTMKLGTLPTADVTVTLQPDAQLGATPATLTFTPSNWNVPQTVAITAVQDRAVEGPHSGTILVATASADITYATGSGVSAQPLQVAITDDDEAGATIVESDGTKVSESGGSDTYTIVLNNQPTSDLVVVPSGNGQVEVSPKELTFRSSDWDKPQQVIVTAVQDDLDETDPHAGEITHVIRTTAAGWGAAKIQSIAVKVSDDDTANLVVAETDGGTKVTEGAKKGDLIQISLATKPTVNVSVGIKSDPQIKVDPKPLVFTPENWKTPQNYEVIAKDDAEVEGDHTGSLTFALTTNDAAYKTVTPPKLTVSITDNDEDRGLTGGGDDDNETTIMPGTGGPDDETTGTTKKTTTTTGTGSTTKRTTEGTTRTTQGETRTEDGEQPIPLPTSTKTGTAQAKEPEVLDGEIVAAAEVEDTKGDSDNSKKVKRPTVIAKATTWSKEHWKVLAPIGGIGMVMSAAGAFLMNGDPIKAAQKGVGAKGVIDVARRAAKGPGVDDAHRHLRRVRKPGKKKKDDEDDDDASGDDLGAKRKR